ncbi:MAG TPA: serine/threonine-protein kinase [Planctomycetaceae bacterium]|nr:serine/threonine-protein kinase [Planctomycetaceae bacterium]
MTVTIEQFFRQIQEFQLVPLPVLKSTLTPSQRASYSLDNVAEILIREGLLTQFQVARLREGNGQSLILGVYVIQDILGCGGIGRVYRARHRMMQRDVAVKVLSRKVLTKPAARSRFQREMQVAARLTHPNLVMSFDAGEHEGEPYLVMEYIPGSNLQQLVKQDGPLDAMRTIELLIQIARGLEYAHGQGIIHRDIKPANLILDPEGTVKVLDLGLAQHLCVTVVGSVDRPARQGAIVGTPDFMSPEQSYDFRQIDERSDIYSLGCTLFYLLTGRPMFEGASAHQKIYSHRNHESPSLSDFRDDVSPELEAIYRRMTAKEREDRYSSATEVRQALEGLVNSDAETSIRPATTKTNEKDPQTRNTSEHQPMLNWPVVLVSTVSFLLCLFAFQQFGPDPQGTALAPLDVSADAQSTVPQSDPNSLIIHSSEIGFALEFDGHSQVILPEYVFEEDHVLIVELDVTPLLAARSPTRSVFSHYDARRGWTLQIQNDYWNLCLGEREFPLVQLNSVQPIRRGELSHLSIVVHPGYAGLYLDDQLQAEWEGVGEILPAEGTMTVGYENSTPGFEGKIQSIRLSKAGRLLVDETGRRLLPESRDIVAEYRFEQGEGSLLGDSSGNDRHGTIAGAVWSFSD